MSRAWSEAGAGYRIDYQQLPTHLRAHVHGGVDSVALSCAMWRQLGAACHAAGCERLLVIEDLAGHVPAEALAPLAQAMQAAGFDRIRTAFVDLRDHAGENEHGEILCRELGLPVRVFADEESARLWLVYGE